MIARLPGPVLCICGPTASGKSALADALAEALGTDVISVDAMQVYRGMDIGTAKTPEADRPVPLRMVDVADVGDDFSVALFQSMARQLVDDRLASGKTPVLCGGTGLYLDAVIDEMEFPSGDVTSESRIRYERFAEEHGAQALWDLLRSRDEKSAEAIHPNNVRRVVRALELADEGRSYSDRLETLHRRAPHYAARIWGLRWDREALYARIDARVDRMVELGLVAEVQGLLSEGLRDAVTSRQAIGYKEVIDHLEGSCTLEEAVELIKRRTRRYAKRQLSWLRRDGRVRWIDMDAIGIAEARDLVLSDLRACSHPNDCQ